MKKILAWAAVVMVAGVISAASVFAVTEDELFFYGQNNILFVDSTCARASATTTGSVVANGETMEEKIWSALRSFMTEEQAAGAMGNMAHEGLMNPVLHEESEALRYPGLDIFTDNMRHYGIGLVQWSKDRRVNVLKKVISGDASLKSYFTGHSYNRSYTRGDVFLRSLISEVGETKAHEVANKLVALEIEYLQEELNNSRAMHLHTKDWSEYFKITDVTEAANYWFRYVEAPGDNTGPIRVADALKYYNQFAGKEIASSSTSNGGNGGCTRLTSSPDYESIAYQEKLKNLHDFNQRTSIFKNYEMKPNDGTISGSGCGIMSVYAAYYMFSGVGLNDRAFFSELLQKTRADGYNAGVQGSVSDNYGTNMSGLLQMSARTLFDGGGSYRGVGDKWDAMVNELKQGHKVMINVSVNDGSEFAGSTHFMLLDHYNAEKDMVYLFDPSGDWKVSKLRPMLRTGYLEYYSDNPEDGMYVGRAAMNSIVLPRKGITFSYNGCYDGGISAVRVCSVYSSAGLVSGGMNYDEAVDFMAAYRAEAAYQRRGHYGAGFANGTVIGDGYVGDAGCWGGALNNCVAFSRWFVNNYTTAGPRSRAVGDGRDYVGSLVALDGFQNYGTTPTAYAVFSRFGGEYGHTGVVLGVNQAANEIYIGEAGCTAGYTTSGKLWPGVHTYKLSEYTGGAYTYAYPGDKLKL